MAPLRAFAVHLTASVIMIMVLRLTDSTHSHRCQSIERRLVRAMTNLDMATPALSAAQSAPGCQPTQRRQDRRQIEYDHRSPALPQIASG